jgi:MraZ protein
MWQKMVKSGGKWENNIYFSTLNNCPLTTFIGEYHCKVDAKGRVMLPAAFKKQMNTASQDKFVVKKDIYERCLVLFPIEEWERQNKIIRANVNPYNREHSAFLRGFYKGAAEIELDASNRMLIPRRLLDEVTIDADVVLAGQTGRIEIWSEKLYEGIDTAADFAALAEKIMGGAINDIHE